MGILLKNEKDLAALILRVGFGFFMAFGHGLGKLQMLFSGNVAFPPMFGLSSTVALSLAVLAEFVAAIAIITGLKTRLASVPLIFTMGVAAFVVHFSDPLFATGASGGSKEMALLFFTGFLGTFLLGSGKYSIDGLFSRR